MTDDPEPDNAGRPHAPRDGKRTHIGAILIRGAIMVLFAAGIALAETLLIAIAVVQFLWLLFAGEPNAFIARFARSLGLWLAAASAYQGAASEEKPFPWTEWPDPDHGG